MNPTNSVSPKNLQGIQAVQEAVALTGKIVMEYAEKAQRTLLESVDHIGESEQEVQNPSTYNDMAGKTMQAALDASSATIAQAMRQVEEAVLVADQIIQNATEVTPGSDVQGNAAAAPDHGNLATTNAVNQPTPNSGG